MCVNLLADGLTNKMVSMLTGLGQNTVKDIDKERLREHYTIKTKDGLMLRKPEKQARFLGIDEFLLHHGHRYATHITDLETGHVLWIQPGKKKQVVYDFIKFVGLDWMKGVQAVACDMNSDFQKAFEEKCPHLEIVFDYFHVVKNFNDKVISETERTSRKDFSRRESQGSKYAERFQVYPYLKSGRTQEQGQGSCRRKGIPQKGIIFKIEEVTCKGGWEERYNALLKENKLLFTADLIKRSWNMPIPKQLLQK